MARRVGFIRARDLASADRALELGNVYADMALMFLGVASILIGLVMLKGVFIKRVGYLVTVAGARAAENPYMTIGLSAPDSGKSCLN